MYIYACKDAIARADAILLSILSIFYNKFANIRYRVFLTLYFLDSGIVL